MYTYIDFLICVFTFIRQSRKMTVYYNFTSDDGEDMVKLEDDYLFLEGVFQHLKVFRTEDLKKMKQESLMRELLFIAAVMPVNRK